jgi:hypothetical protein
MLFQLNSASCGNLISILYLAFPLNSHPRFFPPLFFDPFSDPLAAFFRIRRRTPSHRPERRRRSSNAACIDHFARSKTSAALASFATLHDG